MGHPPEVRRLALNMVGEGISYRATARTLGITHQTVANWHHADQQQLPEQINDQTPTAVIEVDELFTYAAKKKEPCYVVAGVSRDTRLIGGCEVVEHRDKTTMQMFAASLPAAEIYYSDGLLVYQGLVWPGSGRHEVSDGKRNTYTIEGMNAQFRQYVSFLRRKTRGFSKCIERLREAVTWFVYHWNRRQRMYLANRKLRGKLGLRAC